jgi:hypothetical protein
MKRPAMGIAGRFILAFAAAKIWSLAIATTERWLD